jgi:hypothetical protein
MQLKEQALEVSDDQVITQARKVLHAGPLHSPLVREWLKTITGLYENFANFSKSEVVHLSKLEQ